MQFEYGSESAPKGNCFLYCAVINDKHYFPEASWIASNIYVSSLPMKDKLPVVAFPPVGVGSPEQVFRIAQDRDMDVIRVEDFAPPEDADGAKKYFQSRVQEFNEIVMHYVELCNQVMNLEQGGVQLQSGGGPQGLSGKDNMEKFKELEDRFLEAVREPEKQDLETILGPYVHDPLLKDQRFDFQNLRAVFPELDENRERVVSLFFKKFKAIYQENYEQAGRIQETIDSLVRS
jgi:hypothetical protein